MIAAALLEVNERQCDPPLGQEEVRKIAHGVATGESKEEVGFVAGLIRDLELWHDQNDDPFATLPQGNHHENWRIGKRVRQCCRWVSKRYNNEPTKQPQCDLICCYVTAKSTITALWRLGYADYSDKKRSKVYVSTFTISDQDGLVIYQYDKVLIAKDAPSGDELRAKCNWYSCMPESLI